MKIIGEISSGNTKKIFDTNIDMTEIHSDKSKYSFKCSCDKKTPMIINKRKETIYFSTKAGHKSSHTISCDFHGDISKTLKGYSDDGEGNIRFEVATKKTDKNIINFQVEEDIRGLLLRNNKDEARHYIKNNEIKQNKLTFRGFAEKMFTETWNSYYYKKYGFDLFSKDDMTMKAFFNHFYGKSHNYFYNGVCVHNLIGKENTHDFEFVYGIIQGNKSSDIKYRHNKFKNINSVTFECINSYLKGDSFTLDTELFSDAVNALGNIKAHNFLYLIRRSVSGFKKISDFVLLPINRYGLYSESSLECDYYAKFIDKGYLFEKPYDVIPEYGYVPDAIIYKNSFRNTGNLFNVYDKNKDVIVEIFGIDNIDKYLKNKDKKKEIGDLLNKESDDYSFLAYPRNES